MKKIIFTMLMLLPVCGFSVLPHFEPPKLPSQPDFTPKNIYVHHPDGTMTIVH